MPTLGLKQITKTALKKKAFKMRSVKTAFYGTESISCIDPKNIVPVTLRTERERITRGF